ncbi:MAG: GyrI-like domain-containing protein [Methylocystis sp.]|jgi:effector-binding domain-containing protein
MDEEPGLIDSLRAHWLAMAIFTLLVASAAILAERNFFAGARDDEPPAKPAVATTAAPEAAKPEERAEEAKPAIPEAAPSVMSETVDVDARPAAVLKGEGKWDDAAKTLANGIKKLTASVAKAGLTVNGRPIAVFTKTDDTGFSFEAMAPLAAAPEGKPKLADGVEIGASPAGKALKFQHRGAYDEIDVTYEAIAAYLDEKGLDTKDLIVEEYLTDFKGDDANVDVDIYVFLK